MPKYMVLLFVKNSCFTSETWFKSFIIIIIVVVVVVVVVLIIIIIIIIE